MIQTEKEFYRELDKVPTPPSDLLSTVLVSGRHRNPALKIFGAIAAALIIGIGIWQSNILPSRSADLASYTQVEEQLQEVRSYFHGDDLSEYTLIIFENE